MPAPMALEALTPAQLEAARADETLQRLLFKLESEGLDYGLVNFFDAPAREALRRLDPGLADRAEAPADLLAQIEGARDTLIELGVWQEA